MATKQKYTNHVKFIVWNKDGRVSLMSSVEGAAFWIFTMINTTKEKEKTLQEIQDYMDNLKEREAANADAQTLQKGD